MGTYDLRKVHEQCHEFMIFQLTLFTVGVGDLIFLQAETRQIVIIENSKNNAKIIA